MYIVNNKNIKHMKKIYFILVLFISLQQLSAQVAAVKPISITKATNFAVSGSLLDLPPLTEADLEKHLERVNNELLNNPTISRNVPLDNKKLARVKSSSLQSYMGKNQEGTIKEKWDAISCYASATDCNGVVGPNHYLQSVNYAFEIYDKKGTTVMNRTDLNTLFSDIIPDGSEGSGDPVVVYDEHANRWLIAQFGHNSDYSENYLFVGVSQTGDPTGSWYKWSFVLAAYPDYFKIGVREDGYYVAANPLYEYDKMERFMVLERDKMLVGDANPQLIAFSSTDVPGIGANPYPVFQVPLPVDTDGPFAPAGEPGVFISINDDAWGGTDQIWIWELKTDWETPGNSTLKKTQTIDVEAFTSQFKTSAGNFNDIDCITQSGSSTKLDAVSTVLMNRAQYRNFDGTQTIMCYHTINIDGENQGGLRWYELQKTDSDWTIRQQGTYAPDDNSRWMGSIGMNAQKEIAIGYSVAGADIFPGIRFTGQSAAEYEKASGVFDVAETIIFEGTKAKTSNSRWVDYTNLTIDPTDNHTFWYSNSYVKEFNENGTYIASFEFAELTLSANFLANNTTPILNETVSFTDQSYGDVTSWVWEIEPTTFTFVDGTDKNSQNPKVQFNEVAQYSVTLTVSDGVETKKATKTNYIDISTGVESIESSNEISIYTSGKNVCFNVANDFNSKVSIYDISGKIIINNKEIQDCFELPKSGFYIIKINTTTRIYSGKIIIN